MEREVTLLLNELSTLNYPYYLLKSHEQTLLPPSEFDISTQTLHIIIRFLITDAVPVFSEYLKSKNMDISSDQKLISTFYYALEESLRYTPKISPNAFLDRFPGGLEEFIHLHFERVRTVRVAAKLLLQLQSKWAYQSSKKGLDCQEFMVLLDRNNDLERPHGNTGKLANLTKHAVMNKNKKQFDNLLVIPLNEMDDKIISKLKQQFIVNDLSEGEINLDNLEPNERVFSHESKPKEAKQKSTKAAKNEHEDSNDDVKEYRPQWNKSDSREKSLSNSDSNEPQSKEIHPSIEKLWKRKNSEESSSASSSDVFVGQQEDAKEKMEKPEKETEEQQSQKEPIAKDAIVGKEEEKISVSNEDLNNRRELDLRNTYKTELDKTPNDFSSSKRLSSEEQDEIEASKRVNEIIYGTDQINGELSNEDTELVEKYLTDVKQQPITEEPAEYYPPVAQEEQQVYSSILNEAPVQQPEGEQYEDANEEARLENAPFISSYPRNQPQEQFSQELSPAMEQPSVLPDIVNETVNAQEESEAIASPPLYQEELNSGNNVPIEIPIESPKFEQPLSVSSEQIKEMNELADSYKSYPAQHGQQNANNSATPYDITNIPHYPENKDSAISLADEPKGIVNSAYSSEPVHIVPPPAESKFYAPQNISATSEHVSSSSSQQEPNLDQEAENAPMDLVGHQPIFQQEQPQAYQYDFQIPSFEPYVDTNLNQDTLPGTSYFPYGGIDKQSAYDGQPPEQPGGNENAPNAEDNIDDILSKYKTELSNSLTAGPRDEYGSQAFYEEEQPQPQMQPQTQMPPQPQMQPQTQMPPQPQPYLDSQYNFTSFNPANNAATLPERGSDADKGRIGVSSASEPQLPPHDVRQGINISNTSYDEQIRKLSTFQRPSIPRPSADPITSVVKTIADQLNQSAQILNDISDQRTESLSNSQIQLEQTQKALLQAQKLIQKSKQSFSSSSESLKREELLHELENLKQSEKLLKESQQQRSKMQLSEDQNTARMVDLLEKGKKLLENVGQMQSVNFSAGSESYKASSGSLASKSKSLESTSKQ